MVMSYFFYFLFLGSLIVLPMLFYNNPKYLRFMVRMRYSEKARMFVASLLGVVVCIFHMVYYNCCPLEKGLLISSLYVFFTFMSKKNMLFLLKLRSCKYGLHILAVVTIAVAFTPQFFSCAATLAFILMFACAFPPTTKALRPMEHLAAIHSKTIHDLIWEDIEEISGEEKGVEEETKKRDKK